MESPLIVIVGPTASGKSSLAMEIARGHSGEIICSDSRTIYKGMDIGTAKPSLEDQAEIPHWGLDLVEPGERFTAADFQNYARQKIAEIRDRDHVPILVGGSGLYVDGIIFDFNFKNTLLEKQREKFELMSIEQLHEYMNLHRIELPENKQNKRYLIRRIELGKGNTERKVEPLENCIIVGITTESNRLRDRIRGRSEQIFENGVVEEAKQLGDIYGWDSEALTGNVYKLVYKYLQGELSLDDIREKNEIADWHLAKRQLTWFRRNPFVHWMPLEQAGDYLSQALAEFIHP